MGLILLLQGFRIDREWIGIGRSRIGRSGYLGIRALRLRRRGSRFLLFQLADLGPQSEQFGSLGFVERLLAVRPLGCRV